MPLKPMGSLLLTRELAIENKPVNGILMPYKEEKDFKIVEVLDVSDSIEHPYKYSQGDQLVVSRYAGRPVEFDQVKYLLVEEKEIYAKVI